MTEKSDRFVGASSCSGALSLGLELACKRSIFGSLKPTDNQIGWCFGFADASSQNSNLDDIEAIAFITIVFETVFGRRGSKYVGSVISDDYKYRTATLAGGQAYYNWINNGKAPMPPFL